MADETGRRRPTPDVPVTNSRKRHWWRWILASVPVLLGLVVLAAVLFLKLQPVPARLTLPAAPAGAPAGPLEGKWDVAAGSVAGFRVRQTVLGISNDAIGRTNAVTGAIAISGDLVTRAAFRIDLTTIKVGGRAQPQFAKSLDTQAYPSATFALERPVLLGVRFTSGTTVTAWATGQLTLAGVSRLVTVNISGRRDGSALQVAGSIPITFSDWGIRPPAGYGFLGSLASHGAAEFLLVLHRELHG